MCSSCTQELFLTITLLRVITHGACTVFHALSLALIAVVRLMDLKISNDSYNE